MADASPRRPSARRLTFRARRRRSSDHRGARGRARVESFRTEKACGADAGSPPRRAGGPRFSAPLRRTETRRLGAEPRRCWAAAPPRPALGPRSAPRRPRSRWRPARLSTAAPRTPAGPDAYGLTRGTCFPCVAGGRKDAKEGPRNAVSQEMWHVARAKIKKNPKNEKSQNINL